jgi:hypothetical protein
MPTTAEIIAAQKYFYDLGVSVMGKRLGPEREQWVACQTDRRAYLATLTPAERKIYFDENARYNAVVDDQIDRERATAKRQHLQSFTVKAVEMGAAAFAAPLLFGPATGGLYAPGNLLGPALAGEVAIADIPAGSTVAESGLGAGTITGAVGEGASTSIWGSLGKLAGGAWDVAKDVAAVAGGVSTVLSKANQISNVFDIISGNEPNQLGPAQLGPAQLGPAQLGSTQPAPADVPASALGATQEEMVVIPNVVLYIVLGGLALLIGKRLLK